MSVVWASCRVHWVTGGMFLCTEKLLHRWGCGIHVQLKFFMVLQVLIDERTLKHNQIINCSTDATVLS